MPPTAERRLLVVADVQTGYHHDSISMALATLVTLGRATGRFATTVRTDSQLITRDPILGQGAKYGGKRVNARNLHDFDALFMLPSGSGTLSPAQKADLLAFVEQDGKGLIAGHAALVGFFDWPAFGALLGARLGGEIDRPAQVRVDDPGFPGALAFGPGPFTFAEQHPVLAPPYAADDVHVVLRLDPETVAPGERGHRADGDYPVVWTRQPGAGRVVNVAWGHHAETWEDPRFQALVLGAIAWAMGG